MWRATETRRAHVRQLPGGGFAAIEVTSARSLLARRRYHGAIVVERRPEWRRAGHLPPVVATASASCVESVVRQLLPILECNPALGAALLYREKAAI